MLQIVLGFIAGIIGAGVTFAIAGSSILGIILSIIVATLVYLGVSTITTPTPKIGDTAAELIPDGEKALGVIEAARGTLKTVHTLGSRIKDEDILREITEFSAGMHGLVSYVERAPSGYGVLRHYDLTYGPQVVRLLANYADVEASGSTTSVADAKKATIKAMDTVEAAAAGELDRAVADKRLALDAQASAISQLTAMDGYKPELTHNTPEGEVEAK